MKITIKKLRYKDIPWSGGTFRKYEVKTDISGDKILELRFGEKQNAKIKIGDVVSGYIENTFYMGKNTPQRQDFIIDNLRVELDLIEELN